METKVTPDKLEQVVTTTGENVLDLTQSSRVLLVFLRIFACPYCRKTINDISEMSKSLKKLKVKVVFVHQGPEEMASDIFNRFGSNLVRTTQHQQQQNNEEQIATSQMRNKLPFYEVVDPERGLYHLFELGEFDWKNFKKREMATVNCAIDRWGTYDDKTNLFQLGAVFVLDKGGEVFSSLLQRGQTNVHDIAELINVRQDVRFLPDYTKCVSYKSCSTSPLSPSNKISSTENNININNDKSENKKVHPSKIQPVQIKEKHKEYRDLTYQPLSEQPIYKRGSQTNQEKQTVHSNHDNTSFTQAPNRNEKYTTSRDSLPIPISKTRRLFRLVRCSANKNKDRPYTEEEVKNVLESWSLPDVLNDNDLLPFFRTFCTKELSVENVLFYQAVCEVQTKMEQNDNSLTLMNEIYVKLKELINEYLLASSENMVNVDGSFSQRFSELLEKLQNNKEKNFEQNRDLLNQLQQCLKDAQQVVVFNMTDPFFRFRWSVEGQRAAIYSIVQN